MSTERLVLLNANLIDIDEGSRTLTAIRIEGDRIAAIGSAAAVGPDVREIDLHGCSVMPGMFSCHFHTGNGTGITQGQQRVLPIGMDAPPIYQGFRAAQTLKLALESGFTGVVSAGAPLALDASLKMAVEHGLIPGPRIMAGSRDVSSTAHTADAYFPWYWEGENPAALLCDGPDDFRRGVRTEIKRGAEIIKVFATAGHAVGHATENLEVTQAELNAAAEAAHQHGVKIRAHVANRAGVRAALDAGFDLIDHGDGMDEACVERMADAGTFLAPSMFFPHRYVSLRQDRMAEELCRSLDAMTRMLPLAVKAGVRVVLGDDYGSPKLQHGEYGAELDYYVNVVGIPAREVLRWATLHGAELMGRAHDLGALKAGYLADLVIVDGDPLTDVRVLGDEHRIVAVMKGGAFAKDELARFMASRSSSDAA
ncbi:MAG TPA: amidohydrolase family protein [Novosphingobium sp.]|nr:amidohydrolase family protein [Novosphingobium sp.]